MSEPTDEKGTLIAYLDAQRRHALGILEGLDDEALRRAVLASGWSCLAMVQHLALDDERFWFQCVVSGDRSAIDALDADPGSSWKVDPKATGQELFELYRGEAQKSNAIIRQTSLDAPPAWWPEFFGEWRLENVREIILHVMVETAAHAGHLDAAREMIDGRRWMVLTEVFGED